MSEWYVDVAEAGRKTVDAILDKVKKGEWFFLEGEKITREGDCFIHKDGMVSWMSRTPESTPFVAVVEERDTILKPAYDIYGVDTGGFCKMTTNKDRDCLIVCTDFFLLGLGLKDIDRYF